MSNDEAELADHAARIRANPLLREIYADFYRRLLAELPAEQFPRVIEVGSGGGFLKREAPRVLTSDCVPGPGIDRVVDAASLGSVFGSSSFDAVVGLNVFHHLSDVEAFLRAVEVVLRPGGRLVLVEPWFTPAGQWFYRVLHHEPTLLDPQAWRVVGDGRLAGANTRLPTSVFRDGEARLASIAPRLSVVKRQPFHKWLYLLSGGLRVNTHIPPQLARALLRADQATSHWDSLAGIFCTIVVQRR